MGVARGETQRLADVFLWQALQGFVIPDSVEAFDRECDLSGQDDFPDRGNWQAYLAGKSHAEIADVLGVSSPSVRKLHERAITKLRKGLHCDLPVEVA